MMSYSYNIDWYFKLMFIGLKNSSRAIEATSCFCVLFPYVLRCYAYAETYTKIKIEQRIYTDPQLQQVYETGQIYTI